MKRYALAIAWISFVCLPAVNADAGNFWRRSWSCYSYPYSQTQVYAPRYAPQAGPPSAPGAGVTQQNQSVEPDVVLPAEITRPTFTPAPNTSNRSKSPGQAQERRLRPGTPIR